MTPSEALPLGTANTGETPPAVSVHAPTCLVQMCKRADFLRAARAGRQGTRGMMIQARRRAAGEPPDPSTIRIGYTCSKKVGNAVARNRAKRRLRAVARDVLPRLGQAGWDYVLIGRNTETAARGYDDLIRDLEQALGRLHTGQG